MSMNGLPAKVYEFCIKIWMEIKQTCLREQAQPVKMVMFDSPCITCLGCVLPPRELRKITGILAQGK